MMWKKMKDLWQRFWCWLRRKHPPVNVHLLDNYGAEVFNVQGRIIRQLPDGRWLGRFDIYEVEEKRIVAWDAKADWKGKTYDIDIYVTRTERFMNAKNEIVTHKLPRVVKIGDGYGSQFILED